MFFLKCYQEKVSCFKDIYKGIIKYPKAESEPKPNVINVLKLLLINPATYWTLEWSFSTAHCLKTWLRSTMKNLRFNSLALLNIYKDLTGGSYLAEFGNLPIFMAENGNIAYISTDFGHKNIYGNHRS